MRLSSLSQYDQCTTFSGPSPPVNHVGGCVCVFDGALNGRAGADCCVCLCLCSPSQLLGRLHPAFHGRHPGGPESGAQLRGPWKPPSSSHLVQGRRALLQPPGGSGRRLVSVALRRDQRFTDLLSQVLANRLRILSATAEDSGEYVCRVQGNHGNPSSHVHQATVSVSVTSSSSRAYSKQKGKLFLFRSDHLSVHGSILGAWSGRLPRPHKEITI